MGTTRKPTPPPAKQTKSKRKRKEKKKRKKEKKTKKILIYNNISVYMYYCLGLLLHVDIYFLILVLLCFRKII